MWISETGEVINCSQIVICTGTFLGGEIHVGMSSCSSNNHDNIPLHSLGMKRFPAGRLGDASSIGLSASLSAAGFKLGRLQTGTPARLDGKTINFSEMIKQEGDVVPTPFSSMNREVDNVVRFCPCHRLHTLTPPPE